MTYVMVDIEADGPVPYLYSMISIGAVVVSDMSKTFYSELKPISEKWIPEALAVSGFSREKTLTFEDPKKEMIRFDNWLKTINKPMFISDNNGFDWQFVNWYLHNFVGKNEFGHSSTNLGSLYKGLTMNLKSNFKFMRKTKHTHNALSDAIGNAEAFNEINDKFKLF